MTIIMQFLASIEAVPIAEGSRATVVVVVVDK